MFWLRALYVANGFAVGSMYGFVPVILQARGFDPALVGVATGLGSLAYTLALPVWGHIGDEIAGPRRTLQLASLPAALFALGLSAPLPVFAVILCQVAFSIASGPGLALTDAMAVPTLANPSRDYTRLRWLTSLGAGSSAILGGFLYSYTGYLFAPAVYVVVVAVTLLATRFVKVGRATPRRGVAADGRRGGSIGEAFRLRPRLYGILAAVTLIFTGVMSAGTYITIRISDLGGGPLGVGMSNGLGWSAEILGMIVTSPLIARFGARPVLVANSLGFAVCIASWGILTDIAAISVARFATGIFFAGLFVSFVITIAAILPRRLQSTGQTLFQAACFGFAAVVGNLVGGVLYQEFGAFGVFEAAAACTAAGAVLALVVMPAGRPMDAVESVEPALAGPLPRPVEPDEPVPVANEPSVA